MWKKLFLLEQRKINLYTVPHVHNRAERLTYLHFGNKIHDNSVEFIHLETASTDLCFISQLRILAFRTHWV